MKSPGHVGDDDETNYRSSPSITTIVLADKCTDEGSSQAFEQLSYHTSEVESSVTYSVHMCTLGWSSVRYKRHSNALPEKGKSYITKDIMQNSDVKKSNSIGHFTGYECLTKHRNYLATFLSPSN
jgi:hypothetical protein